MIKTQFDLFQTAVELDESILLEFNDIFKAQWLAAELWCLDIETYGIKEQVEALNPFKGEVRLVQIFLGKGPIGVFDVRKMPVEFFEILRAKFSDNSIVVIHNAAFELMWLSRKYNAIGCNIWDTMIASQILYAGIEPYRHGLKDVVKRELGVTLDKEDQLSDFGLSELSNSQLNYSANDVRWLIRTALELNRKIEEQGLGDTLKIEFAAILPYADMGLRGFPVCQTTLNSVYEQYLTAYETISKPVLNALGVSSVANSDELKNALSRHLNRPITATNKTELSQYTDDPIVQALLDCRSLDNFIGYIDRCRESYLEGAVRGNFRQCAPKGLGRATCGSESESESKTKSKTKGIPGVNLHNPPNPSKASPTIKALNLPPVRSFFKPSEGQSLLIFDFSAAHARVAAQVTQDKTFIASYIDNVDCHAIVASKLSKLVGKHWSREEISKIRKQKDDDGSLATRLRNISKNIFYGWLNGAGKGKTLMTIHAGGLGNAVLEDASEIIDLLGDTFTGIKGFHDRTKRSLKKTTDVPGATLKYASIRAISGRRVYAPSYAPKDDRDRGGCNPNEAYIANWMMVESDAKKRAMGLIWKKARQKPEWGMRLANECHDEIDVLCNTEYVEEAAQFCWQAMNGSLAYWVKDLPAFEDPYRLDDCLAESWASK
jgi:DNA polymerase I-like protein with 3'-5' exonuclease and polymerase domains